MSRHPKILGHLLSRPVLPVLFSSCSPRSPPPVIQLRVVVLTLPSCVPLPCCWNGPGAKRAQTVRTNKSRVFTSRCSQRGNVRRQVSNDVRK